MSSENGGPAFPVQEPLEKYDSEQGRYVTVYQPTGGMSLRDYLAGQALIGITSVLHQGVRPTDIEALARDCYGIANAMIAEREKQS